MDTKELSVECIPSEGKPDPKADKLHPLLIKPPFCFLLVGSPGTGKSSLIWTMLSKYYKGYYDLIVIYNGVADANEAFEKLNTKSCKVIIKNEYDPEQFLQFLNTLESENIALDKEGKRKRNVCVVFDDFITHQIMKPAQITIVDRAIQNRRHYSLSLICSTQSYKQANRSMRALNLSGLFVTGVNMDEMEAIADEHQSPFAKKKDVLRMYKQVMEKPRAFFLVNYKRHPSERYWCNLDEQLK